MAESLFSYTVNNNLGVSEIENMFLQMMAFTGQTHFDPEQLSVCPRADDYFRPDGKHTLTNGLLRSHSGKVLTLSRQDY